MGFPEIVVTGMGLVSSLGHDLETSWQQAIQAFDPFRPVPYFDASAEKSQIASPLPHPPAPDPRFPQASRTDLMSLLAAQSAVQDSGLGDLIRKAGLFLGAGTGGLHLTEEYFADWAGRGQSPEIQKFYVHNGDATTQIVAEALGLTGPLRSVMTACSSSVLAIAEAMDQMRLGLLEVCLVGGADAITRLTHAGFNSLSAVDPTACRPFDPDRAGMNLGECAAFLVLETRTHAERRGAVGQAILRGYGLSCDAHHMTAPPPDGQGAVRAMRAALQDARLDTDAIDMVNAHATATPQNDSAETQALATVFADRTRPLYVTGTKSMTGHCLGAAGAIEAVLTVRALQTQIIPPTIHSHGSILEPPFYLVQEPRKRVPIQCAMSNSFAFGGNNGVLIFQKN